MTAAVPMLRAEPEPRLMGILISGTSRLAIFDQPHSRLPLIAHEGEQVGHYRIDLIAARRVELEGPSGRRVVEPGSDPVLRSGLAALVEPVPLINPYRRETEIENDQ